MERGNISSKLKAAGVTPKLTLVGAGPGDPELITMKAYKVLQDADVVLYDALIHPDTLQYIPDHTIKRFVGKRANAHYYSQQEINEQIVEDAYKYGHVVRLKGGDPFVFGRGFEEIIYAENHQIETAVIPGVSSATSLASLHKIPLTARGENQSFWVLTGCTTDRKISEDIVIAAQTNATAVILMGLGRIADIVNIYKSVGKSELPIAVLINGSLENEEVIVAKVETIQDEIYKKPITGPALIIVGEAVSLYSTKSKQKNINLKQEHSYFINSI